MTIDPSSEAQHKKRSKRILEAGFSAILCKGIVLGANAISIPIVVRYLGPVQFGIWVTISTTLALLIVLDLGIASAMTNFISEAYALDDRELAGTYATTGFLLITLIACGLGFVAWLFWGLVGWGSLFGLQGQANQRMISHAVAAAYVVFLIGLPASLAAKFLGGYQEVRIANVVAAIGAGLNLIAVALISWLHGGLVALVVGSSGATVGTNLGCLVWLWLWHKPWLRPSYGRWSSGIVRPLLSSGSEFFILQLAGLIVFNSDNLVISHYLGPQSVTPYSVTWKLVGYTAALQIIMTPALWPAYAEAWVRRDLVWIRRTLARVMTLTMTAAFLGSLLLIVWGRTLIIIWAGPAAVPSQLLLVLMCVWILMSTFMANTSTVLLATNNTKMQAWLSVLAAAINLGASIVLVQRIGSVGVILATIGSYLLVLVGPQTWKTIAVLKIGVDRILPAAPPVPRENV